MTSYDEAYKKARVLKSNIDNCIEYEKGFVFGASEDELYIGGNHIPVVILKQTGDAVTMPYFVANGTGKEIREFSIL